MTPRFPKVCLRCVSLGHYSEDCVRMPTSLGMSDAERAMVAAVRRDRNAVLWAAGAFVVALILGTQLGGIPA